MNCVPVLPLVLPGEGGEPLHVVLRHGVFDVADGVGALVGEVGDQLLAVLGGSGVVRGPKGFAFSDVVII